MSTDRPTLADLESSFYGGGVSERYAALQAYAEAGVDATDLLDVATGGPYAVADHVHGHEFDAVAKTLFGSSTIVETFPRWGARDAAVPNSDVAVLSMFTPVETVTVSTVTMATGATAAVGLTKAQMGVYEIDGNSGTLLAATATDTNLFTSTFTVYSRSLSASVTLEAGERYALAVRVAGSTLPSLYISGFQTTSINGLSPLSAGTALVDLSTPIVLPATLSSISALNRYYWGRFS
jgi:hypothetical protein